MIGYRSNSSNITINTQVNTQPNQISGLTAINKSGQTFYDILTQQPYKFSKNDISINTYSITLRWNYDLIIAMQENDIVAKLSNIPDYAQNLPFIRKIYLDIAGNVDIHPIYNNMWIRLDELTISGDYNVYDYKQYVFQRGIYSSNSTDLYNKIIHNIISKNLPFSIRVYGENYSANFPSIESRALIFNNLSLTYINPPYKPLFIGSNSDYSANVVLKNYITLTYYNSYSIMLETSGNASITNYNIDYRVNNTLASNLISRYYLISNQNTSAMFPSAIYSDMSFNITLTNLMSGSNYYHKIKVQNIYTNNYSEYSDISVSKYTLIPGNNNIGTNLDMSINPNCYKRVSNNDLSNANILYFNVINSAHKLIFNTSSIQPFQITNPYFDSQHLEPYHYGYGKFIDNCLNLVTITMSINNVLKQIINYGGFDVCGSNANSANANSVGFNYSMNNYTNNRIIYNSNAIEDIYDDETSYSNKGFRLKGYFSVIDEITNNNIINYFGDPSSNPYILNINYSRDPSVDIALGSNVTHNIYIDNFIGDPSVNDISNIVNVHEVVYNMSVATIKYFNLSLYRNYRNINSIYKYIVGNRIIANYSTTNNISLTSQNIILAQSDICANGTYIYDDISYTHIAYFQKTGHDFSFNLIEKIYNLNNRDGITINNKIITNHYCDYNSFTKTNNVIVSSKLDLTALNIYEITNIQIIGSALNNIHLKHYTNHEHAILSCTLLYLDSYFNNDFSLYPNSSSYNYSNNNKHNHNHNHSNNNNLNISYNTHGTISYNLNGSVNPSNQGYKWIVFKIYKSTGLSNSYTFNNNNYSILTTTDGDAIKYLPLKTMLKANNLFTNAIVDKIFDVEDTEALMFGHATTVSSYKRFFNIKWIYDAGGGVWTINSNFNNISYTTTASSKIYGSNVNSDGLYCPILELNNDLTIYIGLKHTI